MSNVSPASNSNFSDVAVETGQKIVKNNPDIYFFAPWRDLSFKYIYTRDNAKYGIAFARDVAQVIGFKPLQARDGQSLRDENDRFEFVRTLNIPLGVPTEQGGRKGVLESDVFFVVRDRNKLEEEEEEAKVDSVQKEEEEEEDPENEVCIHFEMQSSGNLEVICKRSAKYEGEQLAPNAVPDVVKSPENLIGIVVFQNTNQDCSAFNVFNDSNTDVKCQGKAHPRMGVVLHMNKNKEADDNTKLDEVIKNRWEKGGISMGGKKIQINEENANFESWDRLKQRIIALSLLDKFKTEDEFKQYVSNEEVRNEFMCMINNEENIKLHKNDEYMREHLAGYSGVYSKGKADGEAIGWINAVFEFREPSQWRKELCGLFSKKIPSDVLLKALDARKTQLLNESNKEAKERAKIIAEVIKGKRGRGRRSK
ncbi:MAG: hypothetical protein K2L13_03080 [Opitutales bacterium]|nr:hypothetical protein [Opitutales bacterium]